MKYLIIILNTIILISCKNDLPSSISVISKDSIQNNTFKLFTEKSNLKNTYTGFNSQKAINRIAEIENEYFNYYKASFSKYYGTMWYESSFFYNTLDKNLNDFDYYKEELKKRNKDPDSMHCTIYAAEGLKAGLESAFSKFDKIHKRIWKDREYAAWSVGYILVEYFNWKAYLILNESSVEYQRCMRNFRSKKTYDVWKQPDIRIEKQFHSINDSSEITTLLKEHEFGWGFSNQGVHTWITRFDILKECNWSGTPSVKFDGGSDKPLFIKTKFSNYVDYNSHIVIFPPKAD